MKNEVVTQIRLGTVFQFHKDFFVKLNTGSAVTFEPQMDTQCSQGGAGGTSSS